MENEINPYKHETAQTDAELLREVVEEYNRLNKRRQYLAELIRSLALRTPDLTPETKQIIAREYFLDRAYEG